MRVGHVTGVHACARARPREDYYSSNPLSLPSEFTLEPFRYVLENEFLRYFANSVFVTVLTVVAVVRSEEHTSELQSRGHLVCRLLLEKKNEENTSNLTTE